MRAAFRRLAWAVIVLYSLSLNAQPRPAEEAGAQSVVVNEGKPLRIPFACTVEDMQRAGLTCPREHPCPIYLELSAAEGVGDRLFVVGNLHAESSTLRSILLASEDRGKTWREMGERTPSGALEQIRFFDFATGWILGVVLDPLPKDPYFLVTTDGGQSWRRRAILPDAQPGVVEEWRFTSAREGDVWIDRQRSDDDDLRYAHYYTQNSGDTWTLRQVSEKPIPRGRLQPVTAAPGWRVRADAKTEAYVLERNAAGNWVGMASFLINAGECAVPEVSLEKAPVEEEPAPAVEAVEEFRIGGPPKAKPKPRKKPD